MNPTENNTGKITPKPSRWDLPTILAFLIVALEIVISLVVYPLLPPIVPSHWNAAGQVNGYAPKWVNLFLLPLMSIVLYGFVRFIVAAAPQLRYQNSSAARRNNQHIVNIILVGMLLVMLVVHVTIIAATLGIAVDITFIMSLTLSCMFIFLGNFIGKVRRNSAGVGIRTPWTIASETVWERTHRLGAWLFVLGGVLGVLISFLPIPMVRLFGVVAIIIGVSIILVIYSYVIYDRAVKSGREPLSPPFDGSEG